MAENQGAADATSTATNAEGNGGEQPKKGGAAGTPDDGKLDFTKMKREELETQLTTLRADLAQARRTVQNREDEAKRVHVKYEQALKEIGDEAALEEFRTYRKNAAAKEEERLKKEGDLEKLLAAREKKLQESDARVAQLQQDIFRGRIERELGEASSRLDAVSMTQVTRLFGDPSEWTINDKGDLVHKTRSDPDSGAAFSPLALLETEKSGANANLFRAALQSGSGSAAGGSGGGGNGAAKVLIRMVGGRIPPDEQRRYDLAREQIRKGELPADAIDFKRERA